MTPGERAETKAPPRKAILRAEAVRKEQDVWAGADAGEMTRWINAPPIFTATANPHSQTYSASSLLATSRG